MLNATIMAAEASGLTFDTGLVTTILSVCKSVMSLFGEYPLNILLAIGIACACFGVFGVAKRSV